ncbi:MAG: hypothetical protein AAF196_03965 [Planctomycetota bacterium]
MSETVERLWISAPFGNYIQPEGALATLGTFTRRRRNGRIWRILKTVRYDPFSGAWVNKIGLRNPGIDWLVKRVRSSRIDARKFLVSVHGFTADEWYDLLDMTAALDPKGIELNLSCPNVGEVNWPADLFPRAAALSVPVVCKLPPVRFEKMFEDAFSAGIRSFHCCNTLPVPVGGMSGPPLKPVALQCIQRLQELAGSQAEELRLIGGGGIRRAVDIDDYADASVCAVAIGTKVMNPRYLVAQGPIHGLRERAEDLLSERPEPLALPAPVASE